MHKDTPLSGLHANTVILHPATTRVDITIGTEYVTNVQMAEPVSKIYSNAALEDSVWIVPDGDGWAEIYGDSDGWPVWDVAMWAPAVSYGNGWVVPNGDGWSPYESHDS
jgi:hypothetical protein